MESSAENQQGRPGEDTSSIEAFDMTRFLESSSSGHIDATTLALCEQMAVRMFMRCLR
jgi:hypothetical protein